MYRVIRIRIGNLSRIMSVAYILHACGKDMAREYDLHHWDNSIAKSIAIVYYCLLKGNIVYLLYKDKKAVATFQTKIKDNSLYFEKLGTLPSQHGKGIGTYCLYLIENIAIKSGCNNIITEAFEKGQHALSFYQNKGYIITGSTYSIKKRREIVLEKRV